MTRRNQWLLWWGAIIVAMALVIWGQEVGRSAASSVPVDEKTIPLRPSVTFVKASFLTGQLQDLKVTERVERATGKVVDPPVLRATLKLKNDSTDQAAHLIGGKIEYRDAEGKVIPLPRGRGATTFTFIAVPTNRLDPGMEMSQVIEVPFPADALKKNDLREVSVELTFLPAPYREDTVSIPVHLGS